MKHLLVGFFLLVAVASFSQDKKKLDEKNGFRDDIFGAPIESYKTLVEVDKTKDGFQILYRKTDENFSLGIIELSSVTYTFYKGKLDAILLSTKGYTNSRGVLDILISNYGNGYQSNRYIEDYFWFGKKVVMSYSENSLTNDATIFIATKENDKEKETDKKESIKKVKI